VRIPADEPPPPAGAALVHFSRAHWRFVFPVHNKPSGKNRAVMIRKLASGKYRLYSRKKDPKTGRRRNLGTFASRAAAEKHERAVQFFKRH
jgi:hypothetical protein